MIEPNDEARLIEELVAQNTAAIAELEALKMSDSTIADLEEIVERQNKFYDDFYKSLKEGEK